MAKRQQPSSSDKALAEYRAEIDGVDRELIRLLARRMELVRGVGTFKQRNPQAPLRDEDRERRIFEVWAGEAEKEGLSAYFVGRVLREILNYSRRDQERYLDRPEGGSGAAVRVGYQGTPGSYSDLAIGKLFATRPGGPVEKVGFQGFAAVADALQAGRVDYAMLPIENTVAGSINEVYDLLARRELVIVGEEVWPVEHCLLGLPGSRLEDLRSIRSHPVALLQCTRFLDGLVGVVRETFHDTAGAAQSVAQEQKRDVGAIASEEAAHLWGLAILRRGIADQPVNLTRFLLIGTAAEPLDPRRRAKTSLVMKTRHQSGALVDCLQVLHAHGINLTKLESRPQPERPWEYLFYVDVEGHREVEPLKTALDDLRHHAGYLKVLGSYARRTHETPSTLPYEPSFEGASPMTPPAEEAPNSTRRPAAAPSPAASGVRDRRPVRVGSVEIGGGRFAVIAGPAAVESRRQILRAAALVRAAGERTSAGLLLQGGIFRPGPSPYTFPGLGLPGLELLAEAGHAYELPVVTEVRRPEDVAAVAERADLLRVGARHMHDHELLRQLGQAHRPVLLDRGLGATLDELLQAADFLMAEGNHQVILCERGIRTFETATRSTLDVSAVAVLKRESPLPVLVDPSQAAGARDLVPPLALAAAAAGADGLVLEVHPDPEEALCEKEEALDGEQLEDLLARVEALVGRQVS